MANRASTAISTIALHSISAVMNTRCSGSGSRHAVHATQIANSTSAPAHTAGPRTRRHEIERMS
ncbi:hypothetical protein [Rhodanobacter lindaniclasticus]